MVVAQERHPLTAEQRAIVDDVDQPGGAKRPHLVMGITGSGKTLVYLELAERVIAKGEARSWYSFRRLRCLPKRRRDSVHGSRGWQSSTRDAPKASTRRRYRQILAGNIDIVVGARSALFSPLSDLA
ncbi:MAG: hypothetical protein QM757_44120 [Paludibaculum sp.]